MLNYIYGRTAGSALREGGRVMAADNERQIDMSGIYREKTKLHIEKNRSTHYSAKTDKQIKIPLPGFDEFFQKLNMGR